MKTAIVLLGLLLAAVAPCLAEDVKNAKDTKEAKDAPKSPLAKKLDKIILPHAEFNEANINDVVPVLIGASKSHDPDKKGVNIILTERDNDNGISMDLENVSLLKVLQLISKQTGLALDVDGMDVILGKPKPKR